MSQFITEYFNTDIENLIKLTPELQLSPKILIINPHKRLSWQYHHRRKEIWSVLKGPVGIVRSIDDNQSDIYQANVGDIITINVEERHRLVGLDTSAVVAELWCHTDPSHPSDEFDIVRVEDDYKR